MSRITLTFAALSKSVATAGRGVMRPFAIWLDGFGRNPRKIVNTPEPLFPGEAVRGRAMMGGRWMFDGETVEGKGAPWFEAAPSDAWAEALHGFGWLAHYAAAGDRESKRAAQAAVHHWIAAHGRGRSSIAWRSNVVGRRIKAWLTYSNLLLDGADPRFRRDILRSLARQTRYLRPRVRQAPKGAPRLEAAAGAVYAGLCLDRFERGFLDDLDVFKSILGGQLSPDGGHFSRRPSELFEVFAMTVALRRDLDRAGGVSTDALTLGIERMTPMLRALRLGDGGLVLLNGGRELADGQVDYALAEARVRTPALQVAPDEGYGRLASGRTLVVVDCRAPGPAEYSTRATAGLLALEASVGRRRLIVSCGPGEHLGPDWARAGRAAAAHSTLSIEDESPLEFLDPDSFEGRWLGSRALKPYPAVRLERVEDLGGVWLRGEHNGWVRRFGLTHQRRLYLSADGGDLRGEDTLAPPEGAKRAGRDGLGFAVRFHLHPEVEARLVGGAISLRLPNGIGWTMRQKGGETTLEESVYLGGPRRKPRPSKQIVVTGRVTDYQGAVNWAFRRADAAASTLRDVPKDEAKTEDDAASAPNPTR